MSCCTHGFHRLIPVTLSLGFFALRVSFPFTVSRKDTFSEFLSKSLDLFGIFRVCALISIRLSMYCFALAALCDSLNILSPLNSFVNSFLSFLKKFFGERPDIRFGPAFAILSLRDCDCSCRARLLRSRCCAVCTKASELAFDSHHAAPNSFGLTQMEGFEPSRRFPDLHP